MASCSLAIRVGVLMLALGLCLGLSGCGGGKITKANADKINTGMSEKEVADILGPPTDSAEVKLPEMPGGLGGDVPGMPKMPAGAKNSVWKDGNKVITVTFLDGKVTAKVSSGF
jgi:hypothetical protein